MRRSNEVGSVSQRIYDCASARNDRASSAMRPPLCRLSSHGQHGLQTVNPSGVVQCCEPDERQEFSSWLELVSESELSAFECHITRHCLQRVPRPY
ncbi:hypothetical protein CBOM_07914 [Ceraceosorus bombacis]|uniref:Uncharacterized protein n=1 Tax=Ceraceosorus bombacis TaxID=401625 RepID=A0A0P1BS57_9BASI|nr:hypothetical protein CBOM_07914 [Ceraceosorus bombacis]